MVESNGFYYVINGRDLLNGGEGSQNFAKPIVI